MYHRQVLRWPGNVLHFLWLGLVMLACGILYGLLRLGVALVIWGPRRTTALAAFWSL